MNFMAALCVYCSSRREEGIAKDGKQENLKIPGSANFCTHPIIVGKEYAKICVIFAVLCTPERFRRPKSLVPQ